jgi:NAD(P)-dependent dehydrogenase (short-subunit alcohol dehydrogenase family)
VETPEDAWDDIQRINLKSVYLCCQAVIPIMVAQGGGSIINVASINAMVGVAGADAYTASKGGVLALTRVIATEWGKRGIRCNCICPGPIDTPMVAEVLVDDVRSLWENQLPIGRIGRPEDPAYAALYFASDESSFVTGQVLAVDGGWTAR